MKNMTAKFCVVESCPNMFGSTTVETRIFRFPSCNLLAAKWCVAIGFTYTPEVHCENTAMGVCSKHFNSFEVGPQAIPQIDFEDTIDHINKDVNNGMIDEHFHSLFYLYMYFVPFSTYIVYSPELIIDSFTSVSLNNESNEDNLIPLPDPSPFRNVVSSTVVPLLTCCIPICKTLPAKNVAVFNIPPNGKLRLQWLYQMSLPKAWITDITDGVCERHFHDYDIKTENFFKHRNGALVKYKIPLKRLNPEAFPVKLLKSPNQPLLTCCIPICKTLPAENVAVFNIPPNGKLRLQWLYQMSLPKAWITDITDGVCERHFHDYDIKTENFFKHRNGALVKYKIPLKRLNPEAFPVKLLKSPNQAFDCDHDPLNFDMTDGNCINEYRNDVVCDTISESETESLLISDEETDNKNENEVSNIEQIDEKDKIKFKDNLHDFGNFIQTTLGGIYDEEIMLETQQKISAICFDAQSKWIEKNQSRFNEFST